MELVVFFILSFVCVCLALTFLPPYWNFASNIWNITPYPNLNGAIVTILVILVLAVIIYLIIQFWPVIAAIGSFLGSILVVVFFIALCVLLVMWLFNKSGQGSNIPIPLVHLGSLIYSG